MRLRAGAPGELGAVLVDGERRERGRRAALELPGRAAHLREQVHQREVEVADREGGERLGLEVRLVRAGHADQLDADDAGRHGRIAVIRVVQLQAEAVERPEAEDQLVAGILVVERLGIAGIRQPVLALDDAGAEVDAVVGGHGERGSENESNERHDSQHKRALRTKGGADSTGDRPGWFRKSRVVATP